MTTADQVGLLRLAAVVVPGTLVLGAARWQLPTRREVGGLIVSAGWMAVTLLGVNLLAQWYGWWRFHAEGGLFCGMPFDLLAGWVMLWALLPGLAAKGAPIWVVAVALLWADVLLMPRLGPLVELGPAWLRGEAVAMAGALIPGLLVGRWTRRELHLTLRVLMQVAIFSVLLLLVVPEMVFELGRGSWGALLALPAPVRWLAVQAVVLVGVPGLSAVQEFASRGRGTPLPYDPPKRLVTTGVYRYVRNPMQLSAVLMLAGMGLVLRDWPLGAAAGVAVAYSVGLAAVDEAAALTSLGEAYARYRRMVRNWCPRWRPFVEEAGTLYVAAGCSPCAEVREWLEKRSPVGLSMVAAEEHPRRALQRLTYEGADGYEVCGVEAFGRALEHVNFGWAVVGMILRLPGVVQLAQVLADAFGAGPRKVAWRWEGECRTGREG